MRKILAVLLAVCMLVSFAPAVFAAPAGEEPAYSQEIQDEMALLSLSWKVACGEYGYGRDRVNRLTAAGYDRDTRIQVQHYVDEIINGELYPCYYLIYADSRDGSVIGSELVKGGEAGKGLDDALVKDLGVSGWYLDPVCTQEFALSSKLTEPVVVYAGFADTEPETAVQNPDTESAEDASPEEPSSLGEELSSLGDEKEQEETPFLALEEEIRLMETTLQVIRGNYGYSRERTNRLSAEGFDEEARIRIQRYTDSAYNNKLLPCIYLIYADADSNEIYRSDLVKKDTAPEAYNPEKEGFSGWYLDAACTEPADLTNPLSSSLVVYAGSETSATEPVTVEETEMSEVSLSSEPLETEEAENEEDIVSEPQEETEEVSSMEPKEEVSTSSGSEIYVTTHGQNDSLDSSPTYTEETDLSSEREEGSQILLSIPDLGISVSVYPASPDATTLMQLLDAPETAVRLGSIIVVSQDRPSFAALCDAVPGMKAVMVGEDGVSKVFRCTQADLGTADFRDALSETGDDSFALFTSLGFRELYGSRWELVS